MNSNNANVQQAHPLTAEDYSKAMNFIGQNLLSSLVETVQKLPPPLRNDDMVLQGLSAFLGNVLYKQFPEDAEARHQTFERFSRLVNVHLENMKEHA